jgi:hypothetical protein
LFNNNDLFQEALNSANQLFSKIKNNDDRTWKERRRQVEADEYSDLKHIDEQLK